MQVRLLRAARFPSRKLCISFESHQRMSLADAWTWYPRRRAGEPAQRCARDGRSAERCRILAAEARSERQARRSKFSPVLASNRGERQHTLALARKARHLVHPDLGPNSSPLLRHKTSVRGRGSNTGQRAPARPQGRGIWAKPGWK